MVFWVVSKLEPALSTGSLSQIRWKEEMLEGAVKGGLEQREQSSNSIGYWRLKKISTHLSTDMPLVLHNPSPTDIKLKNKLLMCGHKAAVTLDFILTFFFI